MVVGDEWAMSERSKNKRVDCIRKLSAQVAWEFGLAHISPIISLVAGLLILIMPRLLNLIVAIFLILNGLIGLGALNWLHH